jgi:hypothetical protein
MHRTDSKSQQQEQAVCACQLCTLGRFGSMHDKADPVPASSSRMHPSHIHTPPQVRPLDALHHMLHESSALASHLRLYHMQF